jgi:hypothetical protein
MGLGVHRYFGRGFVPMFTCRSEPSTAVVTSRPTRLSALAMVETSFGRPETMIPNRVTPGEIKAASPPISRPADMNAARSCVYRLADSGSFAKCQRNTFNGARDSDDTSVLIWASDSSRHASCCLSFSVANRASAASFSSFAARSFAAAAFSFAFAATSFAVAAADPAAAMLPLASRWIRSDAVFAASADSSVAATAIVPVTKATHNKEWLQNWSDDVERAIPNIPL